MTAIAPPPEKLFVSYSHLDASLVKGMVDFLRAAGKGPVFLDRDSIALGDRWRDSIAQAIRSADRVLVFWCEHAAQSAEVRTEYRAAIRAGKVLVPTLLDATPLPRDLGAYQWADMRTAVGATHGATIRQNAPFRERAIHERMAGVLLGFLAGRPIPPRWKLQLRSATKLPVGR